MGTPAVCTLWRTPTSNPQSSSSQSNPYPCNVGITSDRMAHTFVSESGQMVYCWTCGDYALAWIRADYAALRNYASIFSDCLCIASPIVLRWISREFHPNFEACFLFTVLSVPFFCSASFIPLLLLFPPNPPSSLLLRRASGCLPTSDVLLARWCMHISCVFLMLTHVDICTALWDYALGHISCNDESDDGDEDSGRGGVCFYFLPLSFLQYQSVQWDKMDDNGCSKKSGEGKISLGFSLSSFSFSWATPACHSQSNRC